MVLLRCRRSIPHPRCFAKRDGKLLKTNEASAKKRSKRKQEAPTHGNGGTYRMGAQIAEMKLAKFSEWRHETKMLGGKADRCENKGVEKKGIQKWMKTKE